MIDLIILFTYVYFTIGFLYYVVAMLIAFDYLEELKDKLIEKYNGYLDNVELIVAMSVILFYPIYTIALLILGIALCCKYLKYTIEVIKLMFKD